MILLGGKFRAVEGRLIIRGLKWDVTIPIRPFSVALIYGLRSVKGVIHGYGYHRAPLCPEGLKPESLNP